MAQPSIFQNAAVVPVIFFIILATSKMFVKYILAGEFLKYKNVTFKSNKTEHKFQVSFFKFLYYSAALILGAVVLWNEDWISSLDFTPLKKIPTGFRIYYICEMCFYVNELITMVFEPKKEDFYQMVLHHIFTLTLMYLSYDPRYIKFGVLILFVHDVPDLTLETSKTVNYMGNYGASKVCAMVFACCFAISRLIVYPRYLLYNAYLFSKNEGFAWPGPVILGCLFGLQIMHIIWSMYIVAFLMRIYNGKKLSDPRDSKKED